MDGLDEIDAVEPVLMDEDGDDDDDDDDVVVVTEDFVGNLKNCDRFDCF